MMLPNAADEMGLSAFAPAEGSKPIQTPYGSLQLAGNAMQQSFNPGMAGLGGTLVPEESEEDDEEDDDEEDENGNKKRKRKGASANKKAGGLVGAQMAGAGNQANRQGASGAVGAAQAAGERDAHTGRRKIRIEFIEDDSRRHITFSKRKAGIMKKAYELATLTGTQVLLLIVSQTGLVYTFTTPKLSPVVQQAAGRELIQSCLNAPDPSDAVEEDGLGSAGMRPSSADQAQSSANSNNAMAGPAHLATGGAIGNQPSVYNSASNFHDPRQQAALMSMGSLPGMTMNLPAHMHGMGAAYGYSNLQQLVGGHDTAIPYGSYGM